MKRIKTLAIGLGAFLLVASSGAASFVAASQSNPQLSVDQARAALAEPGTALTDCGRRSAANGAGQDIFLSTPSPKTYTGTAWQTVDCTATTFRLPYAERAVVVLNFNAEADCNGKPESNQWCQTRALLNGAEGAPSAAEPSSFAFDSVAGGDYNWQAHSMARAWEIRCAVKEGCQYKFSVQTRMHDGAVSGLWLDEVAAHIRVTYGAPAPL